MSREIRRTPVGWCPPLIDTPYGKGVAQPQFDMSVEEANEERLQEREEIVGRRSDIIAKYGVKSYEEELAEYDEPCDPDYYRPAWTDAERVGYQLFETVSEGTPLTPSFATPEELIEHLCTVGAGRRDGVLTRAQAEALLSYGSAPTLTLSGGVLRNAYETAEHFAKEDA